MIIFIEIIVLCILLTVMVLFMSKNPINTLYNYPPKVQEKVKSLKIYKNKIPTTKNKLIVKLSISLLIIIFVSLILRYVNGLTNFLDSFKVSLLIWTIVNLYDVFIIDILWFARDSRFVFKGTEDIIDEYKNYWFHIKEGLIGEIIGISISIIVGFIIQYIL